MSQTTRSQPTGSQPTASPAARFSPVPAGTALSHRRSRGIDAVVALTVYIVLLLFVPSNLAISALGSLGRPAFLWGLVLALWWLVHRLQTPPSGMPSPMQPVRYAFGALVVIALVSYAAALLRGQPADQISTATTALLHMASWGGVLFITMDGIRTMRDLRTIVRRLTIVVVCVAMLGLVQTFTGQSYIDQISIPGFAITEEGGVQARGVLTRASGTATHPLEYAMLLAITLPLALALTMIRRPRARNAVGPWFVVGVISISVLLSASRTALLGFAVAFVFMLPPMSRRLRAALVFGLLALAAAAVLVRPGLLGTMLAMFTGVTTDPSALSRTNALERVPGFIASSPLIGSGAGTFLPRYYIFDNQWVLMTVQLGVLGGLAFAALVASAGWSAWHARKVSSEHDVLVMGQALMSSCITAAVVLAGFDGLSFPISAGVLFLALGLCGSLRLIANADHWMTTAR